MNNQHIHFCNINSITAKGKLQQIRTVLSSSPRPCILALCETKHSAAPRVAGYNTHSCTHTTHSSGVLVFVDSRYPNADSGLCINCSGSMACFVDVCLHDGFRLRVGVVYMRPSATADVVQAVWDRVEKACG